MSIGGIIFIIGIIITIGQSLFEKMAKSEKQRPIVKKVQDFERRVQQNVERLEQRTTLEAPVLQSQPVKERTKRPVRAAESVQNDVEKVLTDSHLTAHQKEQRLESIREGDLTSQKDFKLDLSEESLVHSLIMAELLSPPKSKR
ncbi:hypothetical protein ERX37_01965 [Macrococcus hajekii]|uniref:Uncharacterized protein n=1 Tax=Macrococcus hajekii TaxID=198482 RepID=A0A4R6BMD2_9STAP|nr:hypothetical protein [Macrococcus hajekii]TDM02878.1 hypothetical protein ERX37_01965 [Macrococcus hajekii]GGB04588.1 hypothetical protein GCM10007190_10840 [Macrococcus hajekii]